MNLQTAKNIFFSNNPHSLAYFEKNEKLNKYLCYTFGICTSASGELSEEQIKKIENFGEVKQDTPLNTIIEYYSLFGIKQSLLEKLSDFYYYAVVEDKTFESVRDACIKFNEFCIEASKKSTTTSPKSYISCYEILEDGNLEQNRLFYMEILFTKNKDGAKVCKIENTFTDAAYRGNGIHSTAIKFLEAVCQKRYIYTIVGESKACDVYEETGSKTLEEHYNKLGFRVVTDNNGTNHIIKDVDEFCSMQVSKSDYELEK